MYVCKECGGQGSIITDIAKGVVIDCPVCNEATVAEVAKEEFE